MNILNLFTRAKTRYNQELIKIDISKLNKNKTYVGLEIGTGNIARLIQSLEHKIYYDIQPEKLASHVFALRYKNNEWYIWENHLKWGGIKEYPLLDYDAKDLVNILIYEYWLDQESMDYWLKNDPGYSVINLAEIAEERLVGLTLPNTKGWVCSQAVAACNFKICLDLNIDFTNITPADFQAYFQKKYRNDKENESKSRAISYF